MNAIVKRDALMRVINNISIGVPSRTPSDIYKCLLIEAKKDYLILKASNGTFSIQSKCPATVTEPGFSFVNASIIEELIKMFPQGNIILSENDGYLNISDEKGVSSSHLHSFTNSDFDCSVFKLNPLANSKKFTIAADPFLDLIDKTIYAISRDETAVSPVLQGVLLEIKNGSLSLCSSDNYRISLAQKTCAISDTHTALVPGIALAKIAKLMKLNKDHFSTVDCTLANNAIRLVFQDCACQFNLFTYKYIDYEKAFKRSEDSINSTVYINCNTLLAAIERNCSILSSADKKNPIIRLHVKPNIGLQINSESGDANCIEEISCQVDGKELEIGLNPIFLSQTLSKHKDEEVEMIFNDAQNPCILRGESWKDLILPIRLFKTGNESEA